MNNNYSSSNHIQTAAFADCLANSKTIFQLMDLVFPVDSCQYYGVLPLKLEGTNLTLGVLDPNNEESMNFVNSMVNVYKYDLTLHLIDAQTHQIILASYAQNSTPQHSSSRQPDRNQTVIDDNFSNEIIPLNETQHNRRRKIDSAATIVSIPNASTANESSPELEGLPADMDFLRDLDLTPKSNTKSNTRQEPSAKDSTATVYEIPPEFLSRRSPDNRDDNPTIVGGNPAELLAEAEAQNALEEAKLSALIAEVQQQIPQETGDFLAELESELSWQKLLEKAFEYHTEIIELTRHGDRANIVASKDDSSQSSIDQLPLPTFHSITGEIKKMARLPQNTANSPRKVVLEKIYNQERILLRLEFTTESEKEMIVVQILRDRALQVYEQKQMDRISEQALQLAQQLEKTLKKIQTCFDSAQITNLDELQRIQNRINHQLRLLNKM